MSETVRTPAPLAYKPDLDEAAKRWEAYFAGDIIDRPLVCVTAPKPGMTAPRGTNYRERVFGDLDEIIDRMLAGAEATYYAGEAIPSGWISFGPDEVAVFCGSAFNWSDDSGDTNWSEPFVDDWEAALPLRLQEDNPLWLRMQELYRRAAARTEGKILLGTIDLHTNMDLLLAVRGSQQLCYDCADCPELIDRAMESARAIYPRLWQAMDTAGDMPARGYANGLYSMERAAILSCDFSYLISPEMFRRWVLPALEEEASLVPHVYYHWDGPGALAHADDLLAAPWLHTISYVPSQNQGCHANLIELFQRVQARGKSVHVWGTPDELKAMHRALKPELTMYSTGVATPVEADALLEWFVRNT